MNQSSPCRLPAILVIDDEVRSQEALRRTLDEDFEVFSASGAAAGMEILENEQSTADIRIVLCDQRMPGMTGVEFLKQVRDRWPDVIRIILSGYTEAEDIIAGVNEAGIWQYLLKPWQPEQLLLTLQRASEVWRLQQDNQRRCAIRATGADSPVAGDGRWPPSAGSAAVARAARASSDTGRCRPR